MGRKIFWALVLVVLLGGGVWIGVKAYYRFRELEAQKTAGPKKGGGTLPVAVETPKIKTMVDRRSFVGALRPWSEYNVAPKVAGRLEKLTYNIGDKVELGALIARIGDALYRQDVEQAKADLDVVVAQRDESIVTRDFRFSELQRHEGIQKVISKALLDSTQAAYDAQRLTVLRLDAEVRRRQALLAAAQLHLDDTRVHATWDDGSMAPRYVGERFVDEGALLTVNQPILSIVEIDRLYASINVIEADYPKIAIGQAASISVDAYPGKHFPGKIIRISPRLNENSRQGRVLLEIPNASLDLKPGMFARVEIEFSRRENAQAIPAEALVRREDRFGVFMAVAGIARFVEVQTGIEMDKEVEIISPVLKHPVITLGKHLLVDGMGVVIPGETAGAR